MAGHKELGLCGGPARVVPAGRRPGWGIFALQTCINSQAFQYNAMSVPKLKRAFLVVLLTPALSTTEIVCFVDSKSGAGVDRRRLRSHFALWAARWAEDQVEHSHGRDEKGQSLYFNLYVPRDKCSCVWCTHINDTSIRPSGHFRSSFYCKFLCIDHATGTIPKKKKRS